MNNRVVWVDIAKGIGIMTVVYAHIFSFGRSCIYLFHMPLFFFLSGIFFTPSTSIRRTFIKKFQTLILPYFFFAAIFIPFKYCWLYIAGLSLPPFGVHCLSRSFFDVPLWFLFVLFGVTVLYGLMAKIRSKCLFVAVVVMLSFIGWYSAAFHLHLPDLMIKTLLALPFFALGHAYNKLNCLYCESRKTLTILNGGGTALLLIVINLLFDVKTDISICIIDKNLVLYMLLALLGIVSAVLFSKIIAKNENMANTVLSYLGKNSLYIFACHWPFIIPLTMLFDKWTLPHTLSGIIIMGLSIFFSLIMGHYLKPVFTWRIK